MQAAAMLAHYQERTTARFAKVTRQHTEVIATEQLRRTDYSYTKPCSFTTSKVIQEGRRL